MGARTVILIYLFVFSIFIDAQAQENCTFSIGAIYGLPSEDNQGCSIAATPGNDGVFVAGVKADSVLLLKVNLSGVVEWTRTFDVIPGEDEHVTAIILDSDGMLAVSGTAGDPNIGSTVFVFRYNPNSNQLLWTKEYSNAPSNYSFSLIQKSAGGNYLESGNFFDLSNSNNDAELLEIDKNNGASIPGFSKRYHLGSSEGLVDILQYQNFVYGSGRYTDGPSPADMRNTLVKLDQANGTQVWVKLGHLPGNLSARLYGTDLVIDQDEIYSTYQGDPVGSSTTNTKIYLQKTALDGTLLWLKQYELPGPNDAIYEIIKSGNGFVMLAGEKAPPGHIIMFKVDIDGNVIWARIFQFSSTITAIGNLEWKASQLIEVGNKLVFTGYALNTTGGNNLLLVMTDLDGVIDLPCESSQLISLVGSTVNTPTFYTANPTMSTHIPIVNSQTPEIVETLIAPVQECVILDTLYSFFDITICEGDQYEGYFFQGVYEDSFVSFQGCDSIRTLILMIDDPAPTSEQATICLGESFAGYTISGIYVDTFQNILGCDSLHTIILNVIPLSINLNIEICEGEQYAGYTVSGFYTDTLQSSNNSCDTIRHLNLNVHPNDETNINVTICNGDTYEGYTSQGVYIDIFTNSQGCDSIRTLDLNVYDVVNTEEDVTICLGITYQGYSLSGIYVDTFQDAHGCDSIHTLTLEVEALEINRDVEICEGEQYDGYTISGFYVDTLQDLFSGCDTIRYLELTVLENEETLINASICSGDNYLGYTITGQYIDVFVNNAGCDSIRTLNLTVSDQLFSDISIEICSGSSYEGYTLEGTYTDMFTSVLGCDSIRTLHLTLAIQLFSEINVEICSGDSIEGYTLAGMYTDTFTSATGCDSIRTLHLTVADQLLSDTIVQICPGSSYEGHTLAGTYIDIFTSITGCDSIRTLEISIGMPEKHIDVTICTGGQFENYTQAGSYIDTLDGVMGDCDSVRYLNLLVTPIPEQVINRSICNGQSFLGYSTTGIFTDTFQTIQGCDSIRTLNLIVSDTIFQNESASICPGNVFEGYTDSGTYIDTFISAFGCDSIRIIVLTIEFPEIFRNVIICAGGQFENYTQAGVYIDTLPGIASSCDTIRHLDIDIAPIIEMVINQTICEGENYMGYNTTDIFRDTFQTVDGCDSIRILNLTVAEKIYTDKNVEICLGDNYNGHFVSGIYTDTLNSSLGCDSIVGLNLNVKKNEKFLDVDICAGDHFENHSLPGIYTDTIQGVTGTCDTIRYVTLAIIPIIETSLTLSICPGENYFGHSASGLYTDTFVSTLGCDSLRTVILTTDEEITAHIEAPICQGSLFGHSKAGIYIDTLVSVQGCDSIRILKLIGGAQYIPNVFSPNNDGINDLFTVTPFPENSLNLQYFGIFDRFGDMSYQTTEWPIIWDGKRRNGTPYNPSVFVYVLVYSCDGEKIIETGDITIVK